MKLFYKPGACSLASHIALRESGLDFTLQSVDLAQKRLENGEDYLQFNPKGQVPALLLDDDILLTEGVAIMQYRRRCRIVICWRRWARLRAIRLSNG